MTDNKDKILDAMFKGKLSVKEEPAQEVAEEETKADEMTAEEREERRKGALAHLMSGLAFRERN